MLKTIPELMQDVQKNVQLITAVEANIKINNTDTVLIDVREPAEYQQESASCAVNIPRGLLEMKVLSLYPDPQQVFLIHCASGARACLSAEQLQRIGYKNVFVVTCSVTDICATIS